MSRIRSFASVISAMRTDRARVPTESLPAGDRRALQQGRLDALVAHAVEHSPFYARLYREHGVGPGTSLEQLPEVEKPTYMAHWDEVPVDRGLRLAGARDALQSGDGRLRGHHLFQTGGSSGVPGVFGYDAAGTRQLLANYMRALRYTGVRPRLPRRLAMTAIWAPGTIHMAARLSALVDVGLYRMQALSASAPVPSLAAALEQHNPDILTGYASTLGLLAAAQLDGSLSIGPTAVVTSAEPLSAAIRERIRAAWGVDPFDVYATSETGPLAQECEERNGLHLYEDTTLVEPKDGRILVTNLFNYAVPLIRFVVDDLVVVDESPCPCGRTSRRLVSVAGRANDVIELPAANGGAPVSVHPSAWTPICALEAVADAEIVLRNGTLTVRAVPRAGRTDAAEAARAYVQARFADLAIGAVDLRVESVDVLPRTAVGKHQLVRRETADWPPPP